MAPTFWRYFQWAELFLRLSPTEKSNPAIATWHFPTSDSVPPEVESSSGRSSDSINSQSLFLRSRVWSVKSGWRPLYFRLLIVLAVLIVFSILVALVWFALVLTLIGRLQPAPTSHGLQQITQAWRNANDSTRLLTPWREELLQDIIPKPCHSHNDYWRRVPLYDALLVGCTGVEADIWLPDDPSSIELRVGHAKSSLTTDRTLSSLYVKPLTTILQNLGNKSQERGIFETAPNQTLTLLLDFKSNGTELWPLVDTALGPLRQGGWLRHWDASLNATVDGPLSIVATGNAPFELISSNQTYRDIFYDAPLSDLASNRYDVTNSYYASGSMSKTIGWPLLGHFGQKSIMKMKDQITKAKDKGLIPRYWSTPAWPVSARDHVWNVLVKNGVGMLNVDDLEAAARWNWDWCVVAGLSLCG